MSIRPINTASPSFKGKAAYFQLTSLADLLGTGLSLEVFGALELELELKKHIC